MTIGVTCQKCLGRLSESDFDMKRRVCAKLGKPFTPPRVCGECVIGMMLAFAFGDDDAEAAKEKP